MLLPLADCFGVSVDELMGISEREKSEKYRDINAQWAENNEKGRHYNNAVLMKKSLKDFPNFFNNEEETINVATWHPPA